MFDRTLTRDRLVGLASELGQQLRSRPHETLRDQARALVWRVARAENSIEGAAHHIAEAMRRLDPWDLFAHDARGRGLLASALTAPGRFDTHVKLDRLLVELGSSAAAASGLSESEPLPERMERILDSLMKKRGATRLQLLADIAHRLRDLLHNVTVERPDDSE